MTVTDTLSGVLRSRTSAFSTKKVSTYPSTTNTPPQVAHVKYLDGLRAIAAIYVVLHHAVLQLATPSGTLYTICSKLFAKGILQLMPLSLFQGFA